MNELFLLVGKAYYSMYNKGCNVMLFKENIILLNVQTRNIAFTINIIQKSVSFAVCGKAYNYTRMRSSTFIGLCIALVNLVMQVECVKVLEPTVEEKLVNDLMTGYNSLIIPTPNNSLTVKVSVVKYTNQHQL